MNSVKLMLQRISTISRNIFYKAVIVKKCDGNIVNSEKQSQWCRSRHRIHKRIDKLVLESSHELAYFSIFRTGFSFFFRQNKYCSIMEDLTKRILVPPSSVKGMKELNREMFKENVSVPSIVVQKSHLPVVLKHVKKFQLKIKNIRPVVDLHKTDKRFETHRLLLLDPSQIVTANGISADIHKKFSQEGVVIGDIENFDLQLTYDNWNFQEIMRAVLPDEVEGVSGFSEVGHIAHFNLRDAALPYKKIIGEVLIDKLPLVKTVVNKLNNIDNTYRTFEMELLAGEENYVTQTKENGCTFELDFSKVYWNSRLGSEHGRIGQELKSGHVVFDVFAGIGPFTVPALKQGATVFANDLNPYSYKYLVKNIKLNKCNGKVECLNQDGRKFIETCVKDQLSSIYAVEANGPSVEQLGVERDNIKDIVVIMNLPAIAITFLDAFNSLLCHMKDIYDKIPLPKVNCYCFTNIEEAKSKYNGDTVVEVKHRVIDVIGRLDLEGIDVRLVRNVAPQKDMMCVTFRLTKEILLGRDINTGQDCTDDEPPLKHAKLEESCL